MSEGRQTGARVVGDVNDDRVDALATCALSVVARQSGRAPRPLVPAFVEMLHDAALSAEAGPFEPVTSRMVAAGIRIEDIADLYVPAVARRMGEMWCDDLLGFAAVTIGVSRLQMMLRDLGPEWHTDRTATADGPALLLMVGAEIYHTLGGHGAGRATAAARHVGAPDDRRQGGGCRPAAAGTAV